MKTNSNVFDISKEITLLNAKLPALPKRARKNLFDILKIQHREIRNSNILAYFFAPNEEHSFGLLFSESLQEIAVEKMAELKISHPDIAFNDISSFDEIKTVNTEEQTSGTHSKNKSIDIVLEGDDWVIGIENKIHHHLANPLNTYWAHLKSKRKTPFGILLTLFPYKIDQGKLKDGNYFLNITHKELIEKVQQNIQLTGEFSNTDIFYLKEYFKNIESHYFHLKHRPEMETLVQEIVENYNPIREILKKKDEAEKYVETEINTAFSKYGYVKAGKWFRREDKKFDLYFYLPPASELMRTNSLWLCFEIRNQTNNVINKADFMKHFRKEFEKLKNFKQGEIATTRLHTHAFIYQKHKFFEKDKSFIEKLEEVFEELINAANSPVKKVEKYFEERNHSFTG
ncbi:MAG: PD-(D/E)XK nuclease family protein [Bacteroidia bacterium]|nr:PD-(D/E)XK nuclease family protein [Bacteroidia bacterium]NNE04044.1 PD-(D/E)XK nuclease family protein [Eudoraea sp.]NNM09482.1 PD-(D/E)XK nuclease family protein [Flavobacteriaceae bacterium]